MGTKSHDGYVYLLRTSTGIYKIGRSKNPRARMYTLAQSMPYDLEFVHQIATDDAVWLESMLHEKFHRFRVKGEWFALTHVEVAAFLAMDCCHRPLVVPVPRKPVLQKAARVELRADEDWFADAMGEANRWGLSLSAYVRLAVNEKMKFAPK
jgi:hypothetical protein